jgi:hypothetical protein
VLFLYIRSLRPSVSKSEKNPETTLLLLLGLEQQFFLFFVSVVLVKEVRVWMHLNCHCLQLAVSEFLVLYDVYAICYM